MRTYAVSCSDRSCYGIRSVTHRVGLSVALLAALALNGCGGGSQGAHGVTQDPLLGTWMYSGHVPAIVDVALTFSADKTLELVEQVAPASEPAGAMADGCVTTDTLNGTYVEGVSAADIDTLSWTFSSGTANVQTGCKVVAYNSAGTPMTADAVSSYIEQGTLPPMSLTYTADATTLVLTSKAGTGVGSSAGTTFTRSLATGDTPSHDGAAGAAGASSASNGEGELTCAVPSASGCPGGLILYSGQKVDSAKQCRLPEVAVSCSAGASAAQTCWADTDTGDLYLLAEIPCKPDAKWRDCTQAEADAVVALPACS
jgi:hypothetical protein